MRRGRVSHSEVDRSAFAGFRFPPEVITVAVRWYLRYSLSYRDLEELLAERGVEVDHVTVYRWVQRFTPLFAGAAPARSGMPPAAGGSLMRPTSRWRGSGATCTGRSTSTARSSTSCCPSNGTPPLPADSSSSGRSWAGAGRGDHRQGRPV